MSANMITEFDILENEDGGILLVIDERAGEVADPSLSINGVQVSLMRNDHDVPIVAGITEQLIEKMQAQGRILVVEATKDGIIREYMTPVV